MVRSGRQWRNLSGEVRGSPITEMLTGGPRIHETGALLKRSSLEPLGQGYSRGDGGSPLGLS